MWNVMCIIMWMIFCMCVRFYSSSFFVLITIFFVSKNESKKNGNTTKKLYNRVKFYSIKNESNSTGIKLSKIPKFASLIKLYQ